MATTNNVQGDEPCSTALERQIQTLTAAMECLTQQNHDLEEQLHQKNVGHDTQQKDQEGTNVERSDQERPEGSNAPSRPERQDMSHPSVTDMASPHIVAEMQAMKEQMDVMINALKGQVSSDLDNLVHQTDSSFTSSVNSFPLPPKFHMPQVENYDRNKDPLDHLESFKTLMYLQRVPDEILCIAFPTTLKGPTRIWFSRLTPNSISTFKELSAQFASHFIKGHRYKKSTACLISIKQQEDETLRSYIARFNKEALSIDEADDKILVAAFTNGLRKVKFLFSLYKNNPKTMSDVLYRATKYMNAEDALLTLEKRERQKDTRQDRGQKMARTGDARQTEATPPVEH
ncbi:uncharacterized protein LOC115951715 [Quercus lobata]|uniref:uncharacterized protein LOC115951715 n=1 Tax=Quercus lobata TaxID=97700 RepID=UPI001244A62C|nr:uncharacterized protein LOC115951715 [Quercus lobata]